MSVLWSLNFCPSRCIPIIILTISTLTWIRLSPRIATMFHVLTSMHNWTNLNFISISLSFLYNPLIGFTTWLGRTSLESTWTWSPNDLLDSRKIYENLLYHRSNDLDFLVLHWRCLVPIYFRGKTVYSISKLLLYLIVPQLHILKLRIITIHQL